MTFQRRESTSRMYDFRLVEQKIMWWEMKTIDFKLVEI